MQNKRRGLAAIISVAIVSSVGLISSAAVAAVYKNISKETEARVSSIQARTSAFSCAEIAMLRLRKDRMYNGNENISVDKVICSISAVSRNGAARTVYAQATVKSLTSRIKVEIQDIDSFYLNSWTEVPPQ
jgi:hypothetical protein